MLIGGDWFWELLCIVQIKLNNEINDAEDPPWLGDGQIHGDA